MHTKLLKWHTTQSFHHRVESCQIEERTLDKKVYRDDGLAVVEVQHDNFQHYNNVKKGVHKAAKDENLC